MTVGEAIKILKEFDEDDILVDPDGDEIEYINDLEDGSIELITA